MKTLITITLLTLISCASVIPLQTNLNDNTLLMSKNKNIKVNYQVTSDIKDGFISYHSVLKNGSETISDQYYKYASETGLKQIWKNYFESKFNDNSKDEMTVDIRQLDFYFKSQLTTSLGWTLISGNSQSTQDIHSKIQITLNYKGESFNKVFDITTNGYQESQTSSYGGRSYTSNYANPTAQKARLIEECYNKGIVLFDNYITSVIEN